MFVFLIIVKPYVLFQRFNIVLDFVNREWLYAFDAVLTSWSVYLTIRTLFLPRRRYRKALSCEAIVERAEVLV